MRVLADATGRDGKVRRVPRGRTHAGGVLERGSAAIRRGVAALLALTLCGSMADRALAQEEDPAQQPPRPALGTGVPGEERLSPAQIKARLELFRQKQREKASGVVEPPPAATAPVKKNNGWVGLVLHTRSGLAFVKRVVPGWPAALAGLKPGDQIVAVDGVVAGAPRLEDALDRLAGPAGGAVEVTVSRPGEPTPMVLRVVRVDRPPPEQPPVKIPPPAPSPYKPLEEAVERFSRGEKNAIEEVVAKLMTERPAEAPEIYLRAVRGVLELGGDEAQYKAVHLTFMAVEQYPLAPQTPDIVRLTYPPGTRDGSDMRELAGKALRSLEGLDQPDAPEAIEAVRRWKIVEAVGWVRDRKYRKGTKLLKQALAQDPAHLFALRADGTVMWRAPVKPAPGWQELVEASIAAKKPKQAWQYLEQALRLDEQPWVYPAFAQLKGQKGVPAKSDLIQPRWPIQRTPSELTVLKSPDGVKANLRDTLNGKAALFLRCSPQGDDCEAWRVALAAAMEEQGPIDGLVGIVVQGQVSEGQAGGALPTYTLPASATLSPAFPALQLLDPAGNIVATYNAYEPGLELRVLDELRAVQKEPEAGGPYLVRGGYDLSLWDLRWFRSSPPVSWAAMSGPQHPVPRLWIMTPPDRLEVMEEGEVRRAIAGLTGIDRVVVAELDGSPSEELLIYRQGDGLLEAINGAGMPRWIVPAEKAIDQVLPSDLDGDGRDEVLVTLQGDNDLRCYTPDGALKWTARVPAGVRSLTVGNIAVKGRLVVVASRAGHLHLLSPKGENRGEIEVDFRVNRVAVADLDGDGDDEILAGDPNVAELLPVDLNGDNRPELVTRAGKNQLLVYHPDGTFTSRMTLEIDTPRLAAGDFDGDGQRDLMMLAGSNTAVIMSWTSQADETSLVSTPKSAPPEKK